MRARIANRVFIYLIAACLMAATLSEHGQAESVLRVRIGSFQTAIDYAPYVIARQNQWIEEALAGVDAVPDYASTFQTLPSANEAVATAQVDVLLTGEIPSIIGRAAGIDLQIAWLSCRLQAETVIPLSSNAVSVADLRGKRVAVLAGSAPYYWFVRNLQQRGLSIRDVQFLDMSPPDAKAAFVTGAVDAWAMFPPWPEQEIIAGRAKALPEFVAPIQVVVAVRGAFARQHPSALAAVLAAFDKAKMWLQSYPGEAQELMSRTLGLPLDVVKLSWSRLDWMAKFDPSLTQPSADFLKAEGFIKNTIDARRLLLPQLLDQ
jgi:sulfonate transport system substrate-binding protein